MRRKDYKELSLSNHSANIYSIEIFRILLSMDMMMIDMMTNTTVMLGLYVTHILILSRPDILISNFLTIMMIWEGLNVSGILISYFLTIMMIWKGLEDLLDSYSPTKKN